MSLINRSLKKAIEAIKYEFRLTQKEIADKLGYKTPYLSDVINGRKPVSEQFTDKLCATFELNRDWLLTGEGEMLKGESEEPYLCEMANYVPLLPISAQGGSLNDFVVSVKNRDCEKVISPIKGADFAMTVAGDSMAPEYPNGAQILIKRINENIFIEWGKVYVLDTANGSVIKIVTKSEMDGCLHCTSINSDQKRYAPFDVPMDEIYGMFRVMLCMATK